MTKFEKKEVKMAQVGRNLTVIIGGEKFTTTGDKETLTPIKDKVKAYEASPTKKLFDSLMEALMPKTTEVQKTKEALAAKVKGQKRKVEEVNQEIKTGKSKTNVAQVAKEIDDKEMSEADIAVLEAAIKRQKEKKQPVAQTAPASRIRRGEY